MFNLNASLKILLEPFNPTEDEISGFASHIKFNGYTDSHYKIKKVLIPALKEQQYLRVFKKIEGIRSQFKDFTGRIPLIFDDMYLVRVDDYPHWSCNIEQFTKFLDIMVQNDITFLLGVTPMLSYERHSISNDRFRTLTENEVNLLKKYKNVEIALHGLTHQTIRKNLIRNLLVFQKPKPKRKLLRE
ncbi:MAG TPA: DUF2334 domain-containing protein [bacterium]|nr:DUF2334 domain-containing protein [bacterium]